MTSRTPPTSGRLQQKTPTLAAIQLRFRRYIHLQLVIHHYSYSELSWILSWSIRQVPGNFILQLHVHYTSLYGFVSGLIHTRSTSRIILRIRMVKQLGINN